MSPTDDRASQMEANLTAWAAECDDIRAVIVIGSRGRVEQSADEWSDVDVLVLIRNPEPFWLVTDWLERLGSVILHFIERTPDARGREVRALFTSGLDVDLVLAATDGMDARARAFYAELLQGGARPLVDKDSLLPVLLAAQLPEDDIWPVAVEAFSNLVNDFWFHTVWTAKKLRRGELWVAKSCCDGYLKQHLLTMLAWHARAVGRAETRVWYGGRFLDQWADPQAVKELALAFAHYDAADVWRALGVTADLFARLARATAAALGQTYPDSGEAGARRVVDRLGSGQG